MKERNYWRMALRWGDGGRSWWEECRKRGVVSVGYSGPKGRAPLPDLRTLDRDRHREFWRRWRPGSTPAMKTMERFAYDMRKGDVIYVKEGPMLVGRGVITSDYWYDRRGFLGNFKDPWYHYRKVRWDKSFTPVRVLLGAERYTVHPLYSDERQLLRDAGGMSAEPDVPDVDDNQAFPEGRGVTAKHRRLERSGKAVEAKKRHVLKTNGCLKCEVCQFNFAVCYGRHGRGFIECHHIVPLSKLKSEARTRLRDLALVCSNCHRIIHHSKNPLTIKEMRNIVRAARKT